MQNNNKNINFCSSRRINKTSRNLKRKYNFSGERMLFVNKPLSSGKNPESSNMDPIVSPNNSMYMFGICEGILQTPEHSEETHNMLKQEYGLYDKINSYFEPSEAPTSSSHTTPLRESVVLARHSLSGLAGICGASEQTLHRYPQPYFNKPFIYIKPELKTFELYMYDIIYEAALECNSSLELMWNHRQKKQTEQRRLLRQLSMHCELNTDGK